MRYITSGELCSVTKIPKATLHKWIDEGAIVPFIDGVGSGNQCRFTLAQALAIGMGRWLRHEKGYDLRTAGNVMEVLLAYTDEALEKAFAERRTKLLLVNGNVMPRLTTREGADNAEIRQLRRDAEAAGITVELETIEVEVPYRRMVKALGGKKPSKAKKAKVTA